MRAMAWAKSLSEVFQETWAVDQWNGTRPHRRLSPVTHFSFGLLPYNKSESKQKASLNNLGGFPHKYNYRAVLRT